MIPYSSIVMDLHHRPLSGLPAHWVYLVLKRDLDYSFARFMASAGPQRRELAIVIAKPLRQRQLTCNAAPFFYLFREPEDRDPPKERIDWMLTFHGSATPARRDQA